VQVLAVERGGDFHPVPRGEDRFQAGDRLVVFGRAEAIDHLFEPEQAETLGVVETDEPIEAAEAAGRA
jgi:Trk K+ transport system NAD-binding subunit